MEKLRISRPIPGIAVSGFIQPEDMERSKEAGFFEHLAKPLDLGRLRMVMQQAVSMKLAS
jgi:CheY-like chemotaxis protein